MITKDYDTWSGHCAQEYTCMVVQEFIIYSNLKDLYLTFSHFSSEVFADWVNWESFRDQLIC